MSFSFEFNFLINLDVTTAAGKATNPKPNNETTAAIIFPINVIGIGALILALVKAPNAHHMASIIDLN